MLLKQYVYYQAIVLSETVFAFSDTVPYKMLRKECILFKNTRKSSKKCPFLLEISHILLFSD